MSEESRAGERHGERAPIRAFALAAALGTVIAAGAAARDSPPPLRPAIEALDHLVWAVADLDAGIDWIESRSGVRAIAGGSHPGRGTRNALLSLGQGRYLEIVGPDPAQPESKGGWAAEMAKLERPLLGGWAVASTNLTADLERLRRYGMEIAGPFPGARQRPDGRSLSWQTAHAGGPLAAALPFLIEWGAGSPHPSADAPLLGALASLVVVHPDPEAMRAELMRLGLDCTVVKGESAALRARIATVRGELDL